MMVNVVPNSKGRRGEWARRRLKAGEAGRQEAEGRRIGMWEVGGGSQSGQVEEAQAEWNRS